MIIASASQFHVYLQWGQRLFSKVSFNSVLNGKAVAVTFNQEKALVGAVIVQLRRLIVCSTNSLPAEFEVSGAGVALDLQDTGGSYTQDFPAMVQLSLQSTDAVILGNIGRYDTMV